MLLKIAYLLPWRVLGVAVLVLRGDRAKDAELLVLRHENAVLRRNIGRCVVRRAGTAPPPRALDRNLFRHARGAAGLAPQAGREEVRHEQARKPGRPPTVPRIARLAVRLAKENPLRGYSRIHGELTKLGARAAPSTAWEILHAAGIDPAPRRSGPAWRQFLHAQAAGILAVDFLHVDSVLPK